VLLATGWFGADPESIRRSLNRHWTNYRINKGNLADGRSARDQRRKLPTDDFVLLKARTLDCGGRVSQAFREARDMENFQRYLGQTIAILFKNRTCLPVFDARSATKHSFGLF